MLEVEAGSVDISRCTPSLMYSAERIHVAASTVSERRAAPRWSNSRHKKQRGPEVLAAPQTLGPVIIHRLVAPLDRPAVVDPSQPELDIGGGVQLPLMVLRFGRP